MEILHREENSMVPDTFQIICDMIEESCGCKSVEFGEAGVGK
jgi:hypothetical protein